MGAPDARRFAVYRNNVAVGLIGALEARYPVSRRIAGDDLFRAMARAFVRAHRPRSPVMIAYGAEFPEFMAEYLAEAELRPTAFEFMEGSSHRVSSPLGEDQGGGSRSPKRQGSGGAPDNLLGQRDPPPLGRSEERPSIGRAVPAPTRGRGCANDIGSAQQALACSPRRRAARERLGRGLPRRRRRRSDRRRARRAQSRLSARNADRLSPSGAALALRDPRRLDLGLGAELPTSQSRQLRGLAKTRSSRVPTATSACASCRRSAMISP